MKNYEVLVKINQNPNQNPYIPNHPCRILVTDVSGLLRHPQDASVLLDLIKHERSDVHKTYLYVNDPFKSKYHYLNNGQELVEIKQIKNLKAFVNYSQRLTMSMKI